MSGHHPAPRLVRATIGAVLAAAVPGFSAWPSAATPAPEPAYCAVETSGTGVELVRPQPGDALAVIDDVNWFARPVPNPRGHHVVAYASHNLNYLYDLTIGRRIRIPDRSDAVATPDGRYMTVPSHYTATGTINFYDLPTLLDRLERGDDADDVPAVFEHRHPDLSDVYYQSVGVVSHRRDGPEEETIYRMMFSGSRHPEPPGFRIVDYVFRRRDGRTRVTPSAPMRLCPEIVKDMATPFISKDGRYVAAHDDGYPDRPASLKIFEITGTDPAGRTTSCELRVDFGFAAGKADFSFDGSQLAFHISKHDYLTAFVNGGIEAPAITDIVIVDLERSGGGEIVGYRNMARVTTSAAEGVGSYFPAFFPDGRLFYISNHVPKNRSGARRYSFTVVDPARERRIANIFADERTRRLASAIGRLWRQACAPEWQPFKEGEAEWWFMSLTPAECEQLVEEHWSSLLPARSELFDACARRFPTAEPTR